ncbi:iron-containing alcohol dehydrogenase family protein [Variovorax sp. WS11]|uniref:iron-containing alcohol dehydrogenase family protein n=1 Tax=Variovorax sp. WS11 TaxID=1105204 RepID=UPI001EF2688F|nr:iron-containing alcohol dehydrogenase family protein [Variovorax sp. WS11]
MERAGSKRAVIICGTTLAKPGSPLELVKQAMGSHLAGVYSGARPDTPLPDVEQAVRELERLQADAIVAVGGGSAITTARAVNILHGEKGHARELCTRRESSGQLTSPKLLAPKLPVIAIPTTPTTATVKAGSAILDTDEGKRLALYDPKARARAVYIHPAFLLCTPRQLVVSAALNTFALALEGLMSHRGDPLADAMLIHATRLLTRQLPQASNADDLDVRADLMAASILCGQGSDYTGAGMAIPVGHAISARFHIDMGISDSIMMPHVVRFNAEAARAGIEKIATALDVRAVAGESPSTAVVLALENLFASLDVPRRLRDVGVSRDSLGELAAIAFDDWFLQSNPRRVKDVAELQQVLEGAW